MNQLLEMKYDDANYKLRTGISSLADAYEYAAKWNSVKFATRASVVVKSERVNGVLLSVPRIVIIDIED